MTKIIKTNTIRRIKIVMATLNKRLKTLSPDDDDDDEDDECSWNDKGGVTNRSINE